MVLLDSSKRAPYSECDFLNHTSLGCIVENLWLEVTSLEIDFRVVSPLANEPAVREVKRILAFLPG